MKGQDRHLTKETAELGPLLAVPSRGVYVEAPCDGVSVLKEQVDTLYHDGCEDYTPPSPCRDRSVGRAMSLDKLANVAGIAKRGADEVPRGIRAGVGVGQGKPSERAHEAGNRHVVREGID